MTAAALTIHFLHHGLPLCGFTRAVPIDWPGGHVWAHVGDTEALEHPGMCARCRHKAKGES